MDLNLDDLSLRILSLLQKNSRMSFTEIGKEVCLSSSTVAERVKRLEDQGIIEGYTVRLNHEALGFGIMAVMKIDLYGCFTVEEKK